MADFALQFGSYTFPAVQNVRDTFADMVPAIVRLPGLHGGFDSDHDSESRADVGQVTVQFVLVSATREGMQAKIDAVRALAYQGRQLLTKQPHGTANPRWCYARVGTIALTQRVAEQDLLRQAVTVQFQVSDPFWYEDEATVVIAAAGTSTDDSAANGGNAPALVKVTVAVGAGDSAQNPTVQRIVGGEAVDEMAYSGVVSAGETLIMDARGKAVTLDDDPAYENFAAAEPDWFVLMPGSNTIRVLMENEGDEATVTVAYYPTYR